MLRKSVPITVVLLLLLVVAILSPRKADRSVTGATGEDAAAAAKRAHGESLPVAETKPKRPEQISPPSWEPAQVFAKPGALTPPHVFPRGENASRTYHETVTRGIDPALSIQKPSVLAKLPEDGLFHLNANEINEHTLVAGRLVFDPSSLDRVVNGHGQFKVFACGTMRENRDSVK
jgi:hypothetical protein